MTSTFERILRRDQLIVATSLVTVAGLAWAWLLAGPGMDMSAFEMTRHAFMKMDWTDPAPWTPGYAALMFSMWWIMMVAMMLPSATPVILLAAHVNRRQRGSVGPYGSSLAFAAGYLLAWGVFGAVATLLQWALERAGFLDAMMSTSSTMLAGAVLIAAGAWQFSPWKHACLRHCRAPVEFLSSHYRPGQRGALFMGADRGMYCLGCCWFLMGLLFVGGVMNLYWIIGLTIYVWVEKAAPWGTCIHRVAGGLLLGWGLVMLMVA